MAHYTEIDAGTVETGFVRDSGFTRDTGFVRNAASDGLYRRHFKRALDVGLVLLAAPFILPVILLLGLLIRLDGGTAFYFQDRIGMNGRTFRIWKLRSMTVDADRLLEAHLAANPAARAEWERTQKLRNDPRVTPIGQLIRPNSLDELPQLWNVLNGDMSLVGPRPMMPGQAALYPGVAYYGLRPGVTGFWQISRRNGTSFAGRAAYDTLYARRLSFGTDLRVLFATIWVVLRGTGY